MEFSLPTLTLRTGKTLDIRLRTEGYNVPVIRKKGGRCGCLGYMGVSENGGTPKPSILIGIFQYFHHPFWGTPILGTPI